MTNLSMSFTPALNILTHCDNNQRSKFIFRGEIFRSYLFLIIKFAVISKDNLKKRKIQFYIILKIFEQLLIFEFLKSKLVKFCHPMYYMCFVNELIFVNLIYIDMNCTN